MDWIKPKPYIYISLLLFILLVSYDSAHTYNLWRTGKRLARESVAYERHLPEAKQRVLFIGDSTAVGTGANNSLLSIAGRFGSDCPNIEIINLGKNGDRTARLAQRFDLTNSGIFDIVFVQIGGNDVVYFSPLKQVEEDIQIVLAKAEQHARHVILLSPGNVGVAPFFPRIIDGTYSRRSEDLRQIFSKAALSRGDYYLDLYDATEENTFISDPIKFFAGDQFHPNADGYGLWYEKLKKLLGTNQLVNFSQTGDCLVF